MSFRYRFCPECGRNSLGPRGCTACIKTASAIANAPKPKGACRQCAAEIVYGLWCPACYAARKAAGLPLTYSKGGAR